MFSGSLYCYIEELWGVVSNNQIGCSLYYWLSPDSLLMRKTGFIISLLLLVVLISRSGDPLQLEQIYLRYEEANLLFQNKGQSPEQDSTARIYFEEVIDACRTEPGVRDSLLFNALWKRAALANSETEAIHFYQQAFRTAAESSTLEAKQRYEPLVLAGDIYYHRGLNDSAFILLDEARTLQESLAFTSHTHKLYTLIGTIYLEEGKYRDAKNCFEKAWQQEGHHSAAANYQFGRASSKTGDHYGALSRLLPLLAYEKDFPGIVNTIGNVYLNLNDPAQALQYFHQSLAESVNVQLYNWIGRAHLQLKQYDSAKHYLDLFTLQVELSSGTLSPVITGEYHMLEADYYMKLGQHEDALHSCQRAINQFAYPCNNLSVNNNPEDFVGVLSPVNLFIALTKKAACFEMLYQASNSREYLQSASNSYKTAIMLAATIATSLENDAARDLLQNALHTTYHKLVNLIMQLHQQQPDDSLLWKARNIAALHKTFTMQQQLKASGLQKRYGQSPDLQQQELLTKRRIARIQQQLDNATDAQVDILIQQKKNLEFTLQGILTKMGISRPEIRKALSTEPSPATQERAILEFYQSDSLLYVFAITDKTIKQLAVPVSQLQASRISEFTRELSNGTRAEGRSLEQMAKQIFSDYLQPVWNQISDRKYWTIIPDGPFCNLNFEVLINPASSRMLIQDYTISYQVNQTLSYKHSVMYSDSKNPSILALAPFTKRSTYSHSDSMLLAPLPGTEDEITDIPGLQLRDTAATKISFLSTAGSHNIWHFATHTIWKPNQPTGSYISFYPSDSVNADAYQLQLDELLQFNLHSTRLLVFSACETDLPEGAGGEQTDMLSRSIVHAGCPSVVTNRWPGADKATAAIINRFYQLLEDGAAIDEALRQAKLDFVKKYPQQMHPSNWAHLTLTGDVQPIFKNGFRWQMPLSATGMGLLVLTSFVMFYRNRSQKAV